MKVGDYVRTKHYGIAKIINVYNNTTTFYSSITIDKIDSFGRLGVNVSSDENIIKSSPNIIDLIEVGDYVNGLKVTLINEPSMANCNKRLLYAEDEEGYLIKMFNEKDIKSIVTHEQFSQMEYKVGE